MTTPRADWEPRYADRAAGMRASEIRELLKVLEQPDIISAMNFSYWLRG